MIIGHNSVVLQVAVYSGVLPADTQLSLTDSCHNPVSGILELGSVEVGSVWSSCVWAPNCFHSSSVAPSCLQAQSISIFKGSWYPARVFKTCRVRFSTPQRPTDAPSSSWDNCTSLLGLSTTTHYQLGILAERVLKILELSQKYILMELKSTGRSILK